MAIINKRSSDVSEKELKVLYRFVREYGHRRIPEPVQKPFFDRYIPLFWNRKTFGWDGPETPEERLEELVAFRQKVIRSFVMFSVGNKVNFEHDGHTIFGEVVDIAPNNYYDGDHAYDIAVETPHPPMFDMAYNEPFIMKHHPEADIHMSRTTENLGRPLKIDIDLMNELDEMKKFDGKSRYLSVYKAMRGNPEGLEFDVENLVKEYDAFEPEYFASLPKPKYEVGDRVMFMIYPHWYVGTIEEVTFGNLDAPNYHSYKVSSPDSEYDHWDKESRIIPLGKE